MKTDTPSARSSRRSAGAHSFINVLLVAFILGAANYIAFKHYYHQDLSASQFYTLSAKTKDVLKSLDSPLTIYTYLDPRSTAQIEQIETLLKEYQRVGGKNVVVEKIDPIYNPTRATELYKQLHFDANDHLVIFSYKNLPPRFVKQDDIYEVNPATQQPGAFKGEQQFTATILGLIEGKVSKVYFTEGHGEHSIEDSNAATGYGAINQVLKGDNLETENLNLAEHGEVPADADAVIIAGPAVAFSPVEAQALDHYLDNHGKLLILLDPYMTLGLDDLLKKYGLKFDNDLVLYRAMTSTGSQLTVPLAAIYQGGFSTQPITARFAQANLQLLIQPARSITILTDNKGQPDPKVQFLLETDASAWGWINTNPTLPAEIKDLAYNRATDIVGPLTVAAEYDGGTYTDPASQATLTDTRVIVVGSSRFLENDAAESVGANFFSNCIDWLVKKQAILDISPKTPQEYGLSLSPMQARTVEWTALFFVPGAAFLIGILTWFSRRK
jgi:ABC-type uncharacterized transport system involved in gliding motility auxiliary subunit